MKFVACTLFVRLGRAARLLLYLNKFVNSLVPTSFANGCRQLLTLKKEVRLSLCLIKHHAMTTYGRMEVGYGSFTHSAVDGSER